MFSYISNRPDLRGIHADFDCHSISCCPVASGRQSRGLLQRAGRSKKRKKRRSMPDGILRLFASTVGRKRPPRNDFLSVYYAAPWRCTFLRCRFAFGFLFFRRMGALVPLLSPFLPNLLRPDLLRPKDNIAASRSFLPSAPCVS